MGERDVARWVVVCVCWSTGRFRRGSGGECGLGVRVEERKDRSGAWWRGDNGCGGLCVKVRRSFSQRGGASPPEDSHVSRNVNFRAKAHHAPNHHCLRKRSISCHRWKPREPSVLATGKPTPENKDQNTHRVLGLSPLPSLPSSSTFTSHFVSGSLPSFFWCARQCAQRSATVNVSRLDLFFLPRGGWSSSGSC